MHRLKASIISSFFCLAFYSSCILAQTQDNNAEVDGIAVNEVNTTLRQGLSEFDNLKNTPQSRMEARKAAQAAVAANAEAKQYEDKGHKENFNRSNESDWAKALSVSNPNLNHVVDNANINFGIDSSAQRKLDRAVMIDIKEKKLEGKLSSLVQAVDYGQDLIGSVSIDSYKKRWQEQIAAQVKSNNGKRINCKVFSNDESVSVIGSDCMPNYAFERIEARADKNGNLASVMLVELLPQKESEKDVIYYLEHRYKSLNIEQSDVAEVAKLEKDLCTLMSALVKDNYNCYVRFYRNSDNYLVYKYSDYSGRRRAIYMHGNAEYFNDIESQLLKRRLALVRQDLSQKDIPYKHLLEDNKNTSKVIPNEPSAIISSKELNTSGGIRTSL